MGLQSIPRCTLEHGVYGLEALLYKGKQLPDLSRLKLKHNSEIKNRYAEGEAVPDLAKEYSISEQRVYQILSGKYH